MNAGERATLRGMNGALLSLAAILAGLASTPSTSVATTGSEGAIAAFGSPTGAEPLDTAKAAADVVGSWRISSAKLMNGNAYTGNVSISPKSDFYELEWALPNQPKYGGVGIIVGDKLGVGWGTGADYGVVVYDVAGGKLTGSWTVKGAPARGVENLDGPAGLNGVYKITKATTPTGGTYAGEVSIKPNGAVYDLLWRVGSSSYKGVGLKDGSKLIVGWSTGGGAGVVLYKVLPKKLDGIWANPENPKTSVEVLEK